MIRRLAATAVLFLVASILMMVASPPPASAQIACDAGSQTEFTACMNAFNTAAADEVHRIEMTGDIAVATFLPAVDNGVAALTIDGNGYTLRSDGVGFGLVANVNSLMLSIEHITIIDASIGVLSLGGPVEIAFSTITGNTNGVYLVDGSVSVLNSTFHDNSSLGIYAEDGSVINASGSTFTGSATALGAADAFSEGSFEGNLIATDGPSCAGMGISGTSNVVNDTSCDKLGEPTLEAPGLDDGLADDLALNGCTEPCTRTLAFRPGSPAMDAYDCAGGTDQRGAPRTAGLCDAGAYELGDCTSEHSVASALELDTALGCFNLADPGTTTTVDFVDDFATGSILVADNPGRALLLNGNGHTLAGTLVSSSGTGTVTRYSGGLTHLGGDSTISDLNMTEFINPPIWHAGGVLDLVGSTATQAGVRETILVEASGLTISTSTIVGQVRFTETADVTIENSTIAASLTRRDGLLDLSLVGSIIIGDCAGIFSFTDLGGNVFSEPSCPGTAAPDLAASVSTTLAANGCTAPCTPTLALLAGSPAIDANTTCAAGLEDQRGVARSAGKCDAGAFELGDVDVDDDGSEGPLGDDADCDDNNPAVNPAATEVPYNGVDDNCDGADLLDVDGDGSPALSAVGGAPDCDDTNPAINPGATDVAYNGVDENCNGTDRNDLDGDGSPSTASTGGTPDCDDTDPAINPSASDVADNGVDENCDGVDATVPTSDGMCNGLAVTIDMNLNGGDGTGTSGDDVILGTPDADVIDSGDGDDTICSDGGDDMVDTGAGDDWVLAGGGADTVNTGDGADWVRGASGDDIIAGGAGDDKLFGVSGNDTIRGGDGDDTIHGNLGNDTLYGDDGADRIFGYADDDVIYGGGGNDKLHGNFGEDEIHGEGGDDIIIGYGDDDELHGGPGDDRMHGNFGNDLMFGDDGNDIVWGYGDDDTMNGGIGNDIMNGNFGDDTINGNQGNDRIQGAHGNDIVNGGNGNDTLFGNTLNDTITGGSGDDTIDGGNGNDTCNGNTGTDTNTNCETGTP